MLRGVVGVIKWGYYNAAAINGYVVARRGRGPACTLTATVVDHNAYNLAQRPLFFVAPHARGEWRWPVQRFTLVGGRLEADLAPPV